jgi:hypothetical protein
VSHIRTCVELCESYKYICHVLWVTLAYFSMCHMTCTALWLLWDTVGTGNKREFVSCSDACALGESDLWNVLFEVNIALICTVLRLLNCGKWLWPITEHYSEDCLPGLRQITRNLIQVTRLTDELTCAADSEKGTVGCIGWWRRVTDVAENHSAFMLYWLVVQSDWCCGES